MEKTRIDLLADLSRAYIEARRHKRGKEYVKKFDMGLVRSLVSLRDEIFDRVYKPGTSECFIVHDPKMREVFAADFRDRVVHHLLYGYLSPIFERTFIADCYSCIKGRGTHYGVARLRHHLRSAESENDGMPVYILKVDIKGYFMSIDRARLLGICMRTLEKAKGRKTGKDGKTWEEVIDFGLAEYLLREIALLDPTKNYRRIGSEEQWRDLPPSKSLFTTAEGCGLPIGNLTSQLFSNVYLNEFDQFCKRELKCGRYGRYVDDVFVVSADRRWLKSIVRPMAEFLRERLGREINYDKLRICRSDRGVEFLGAYVRTDRTYISSGGLRRMRVKLRKAREKDDEELRSTVNSYLGILRHHKSYGIRIEDVAIRSGTGKRGYFNKDYTTFYPVKHIKKKEDGGETKTEQGSTIGGDIPV